ncbi:MAG: porphobilinogen synthase, partial [Pseudomonadota bacterium]
MTRMRRRRAAPWSRALVAETSLSPSNLIWAIVLRDGEDIEEPVASMPGVHRLSVDRAVEAAKEARALGVPALALFPYTGGEDRNETASKAFDSENLMCRAARAIKDAEPDIGLMADVALDPYTDHGHDGLMRDGEILNDETIDALVRQAIVEASAGFDIVAPSDMMDGRIGAIRRGLDAENLQRVQIISYAAKYASVF